MPRLTTELLLEMYQAMLDFLGPSGWWPAQSPFEMAVGAILTQNTNWQNVEKAIANLRDHDLLEPRRLDAVAPEELERLIQPSGFYRQKARNLQAFLDFLREADAYDLAVLAGWETGILRNRLLAVRGIGPETADSILLYALGRPVFVVDAYTARICQRHGLLPEDAGYDELQALFAGRLPENAALYNEYHALLVRVGKGWCRKKAPECHSCPLREFSPSRA
ncbi:MAG TPA: endonuclease III domain-containing protein [Desulfonatronum sp.]|nr:endonuclease III domain-containing protein [Desulfonatronum sp.]